MIEDYSGDSFWDSVLGFSGAPGVTSGVGGITCNLNGDATAAGLADGFNNYVDFCFTHQTYDQAFWASAASCAGS